MKEEQKKEATKGRRRTRNLRNILWNDGQRSNLVVAGRNILSLNVSKS